jgi:predicted  nucleic acid-binding Zn-ribbon protein
MEEETLELLYRPPHRDTHDPLAKVLDEVFNELSRLREELSDLRQKMKNYEEQYH